MCTKLSIQYAPTKSINTRRGGGGDMNIISKDVWVKKEVGLWMSAASEST